MSTKQTNFKTRFVRQSADLPPAKHFNQNYSNLKQRFIVMNYKPAVQKNKCKF